VLSASVLESTSLYESYDVLTFVFRARRKKGEKIYNKPLLVLTLA
jgi:hypothetical protein